MEDPRNPPLLAKVRTLPHLGGVFTRGPRCIQSAIGIDGHRAPEETAARALFSNIFRRKETTWPAPAVKRPRSQRMQYRGLRGWLEQVTSMGELRKVDGAHWDAEMGSHHPDADREEPRHGAGDPVRRHSRLRQGLSARSTANSRRSSASRSRSACRSSTSARSTSCSAITRACRS